MFAALVKRILLSSVTSLFSGANTRSAESSLQDVSVDRSSKETTIIEDNLQFVNIYAPFYLAGNEYQACFCMST